MTKIFYNKIDNCLLLTLLVHGYSRVDHIKLLSLPILLLPKSSSSDNCNIFFLISRSSSFSFWLISSWGKYFRAQHGSRRYWSMPQYSRYKISMIWIQLKQSKHDYSIFVQIIFLFVEPMHNPCPSHETCQFGKNSKLQQNFLGYDQKSIPASVPVRTRHSMSGFFGRIRILLSSPIWCLDIVLK